MGHLLIKLGFLRWFNHSNVISDKQTQWSIYFSRSCIFDIFQGCCTLHVLVVPIEHVAASVKMSSSFSKTLTMEEKGFLQNLDHGRKMF